MIPSGHTSVMASRREPPDSLDFFPTPPWGTRALCEILRDDIALSERTCWEPACGEGHMAAPLKEYFAEVYASDVFPYGSDHQDATLDFLAAASAPAGRKRPDWIITNPPFKVAESFAANAIAIATEGVALLVRTSWLEGVGRYERLFSRYRPAMVAQFVERLPMHRGRWEPNGSTATSYVWVVWYAAEELDGTSTTEFVHIPPGRQKALTRPDDIVRFAAKPAPGGLL